ncbi:MAG TPA: hypothetical protein VFV87_00335, partial [Pirellulaceae bacterium]|nr:hypothetical protein [Pirellulaceae bacterium]
EPRIGSTLRYFSRDIGAPGNTAANATAANAVPEEAAGGTAAAAGMPTPPVAVSGTPVMGSPPINYGQFGMGYGDYGPQQRPETWQVHPQLDDWHFLGYESSPVTGVAAWNDQGAASSAARQSLAEAAGIEIPQADFVIKVLAIYLLVLVPLNWLVFWLMGRVEWAWLAAPLIAIVGAGAVIRLAQLDIGFARSRTEIAILEVQGNYERAHLTRYTALYTSLSSTYALGFEDQSALALPFPSGKRDPSPFEFRTTTDVAFRRDKEATLDGVKVSSNSTGMVHSEQMYPLGDDPKLTETLALVGDDAKGYSLRNTTDLTIRDIGIFRRGDNVRGADNKLVSKIETAYIAELKPQTSAPLAFRPLTGNTVWLPEWSSQPIFATPNSALPEDQKGIVRLTRLATLATQQLRLIPGDVRLVGWTEQPLRGLQIRPAAPQNATYTLVLAHLFRGALPPVKPDKNVAEDYFEPAIEPEPEPDPNAPLELTPEAEGLNPGLGP